MSDTENESTPELGGGGVLPKENKLSTLSYTEPICVEGSTGYAAPSSQGGPGVGTVDASVGDVLPVAHTGTPTSDDWLQFLLGAGFWPKVFLTLTYGNDYSEMPAEWVRSTWAWLVGRLNRDVGGPNYKRHWKHSYFSYVMTLEYQRRGALHIHALVDGWLDFALVHKLWSPKFGGRYGFAWISKVPRSGGSAVEMSKAGDQLSAMRYVLKYVLKDSQPLVWLKRKSVEVRQVKLDW